MVDNPPKYSHIKLYLEGLYNISEQNMSAVMNDASYQFGNNIADHITLILADPYFPYAVTDTFNLALQTNGILIFDVPCWINGYHYLKIKSRNHLETWSMHAISFDSDSTYYDFSTSADKVAGENQKQVSPGIYALLIGDVNQDGVVDISDLVDMDSDITNGTLGYIVYDLNGDGVIDISDLVKIDENLTTGAVVFEPYVTLACVSTTNASAITTSAATVGGNITCDGSAIVTERGICYSTSPNPTTSNTKVINGSGLGSFNCNLTGLLSNTTYYAKAYATNNAGTAYGNEVFFTTLSFPVYDIDGNGYDTVYIGTQIWMKQNLKTTKYRNGNVIPNVTDNVAWSNLTTGAYCNYNNDTNIANTYGRLYNWYTVNDSRNLCPTSWHAPTDSEWTTLTTYLGGEAIAGGKLKESGTTHWASPNTGATDETNFTALPGGGRNTNGTFGGIGSYGFLWSSTEISLAGAWHRSLFYDGGSISKNGGNKAADGFSIRCLKGDIATVSTNTITGITQTTAISGGNITSDGEMAITARGVCWSTSPNPTISLTTKTTNGNGTGNFTSNINGLAAGTTYYVRAYATNSAGTAYGSEISFTTSPLYVVGGGVTDYDGNIYESIILGNQEWLKQNLKVTHYKNGNVITYPGIDNIAWQNNTSGAFAWYNNDEASYKNTYGALYNWYAVNTGNLCPIGWHAPTDNEWSTLSSYLGGDTIAGGKLKEAGLSHWQNPNTGGTNESGFTALPSGSRYNDTYSYLGEGDFFWSTSESISNYAWMRLMDYNNSKLDKWYYHKSNGYSVRCLKDYLAIIISTAAVTDITQISAISGGNIISDGGLSITARGICLSTLPNPTIALTTKTTNGTGTGSFISNITGLTAGTTYYVRAYATNSIGTTYGNEVSFATTPFKVYDLDGNAYDTVQVGTQIWMKQNLKTTKYRNGNAIPNITDYTAWSNLQTGAYCNYNNDTNFANTYGRLYNWFSVNTGSLCPTGWHVPSDGEWSVLTDYIGGESIAGNKLKEIGTIHWNSPNTGATNETGFTALPGGSIEDNSSMFNYINDYGFFWSSSEQSGNYAWYRRMSSNLTWVFRLNHDKHYGLSIRCMKN
jgi:uncharacterized protein (TIGR02145 family)